MGNTNTKLLYAVPTLIWGSTWLAIKFQLGTVAPELSIVYRFGLATTLLMAFIALRRLPMRFHWRDHVFIVLQGFFLFSLNYYLVYLAELSLPGGLVAVVFSTIIVMNSLFGALFLKMPIRMRVVVGAVLGITGLVLVFWPQLRDFDLSDAAALGLVMSLLSAASASLGNILAARNQRAGLPVIQTEALGMAYGTLFTLGVVLFNGRPLIFDWSAGYVSSLLYLALFGSVVAFATYLTLIGRIGADRAAYVTVLFPIVALILATFFEGFEWTLLGLVGVALVLVGNFVVLTRIGARRPQMAEEAV